MKHQNCQNAVCQLYLRKIHQPLKEKHSRRALEASKNTVGTLTPRLFQIFTARPATPRLKPVSVQIKSTHACLTRFVIGCGNYYPGEIVTDTTDGAWNTGINKA